MRYGFVKVCAATPNIRVADVPFNTKSIISAIEESGKAGSDLTIFSELCVTGYTCGDLFQQKVLLEAAQSALLEIAKSTAGYKTLVFVGAPIRYRGRLYNCAVAISDGEILGVIPKSYLPNYGEFYERRHFSPAPSKDGEVTLGGKKYPFYTNIVFRSKNCKEFAVSAEICEDLWAPLSPSVFHAKAGANIIVNLSCSDETVGKAEYRRNLVKMQSGKLISGYVYCDAGDGESTTDMVFAGHNLIAENGAVLAESSLFENKLLYGEIDVEAIAAERARMASSYFVENDCGEIDHSSIFENYIVVEFESAENERKLERTFSRTPFVPDNGATLRERTELILSIQSKGLEKRLIHSGSKTAVIGISGGLDSALALLVTCRTFRSLGKSFADIIAVTMPGFGTTGKTKNNSLRLIEAMGVTAKIIPIADSVSQHFKDIGHDSEIHDVTYENAQARMRTMILMDLANKTGGMVIGTGDLSELALGWATYNGDHMSMYSVNSSVPKTLVKHLIGYEAERLGGEIESVLKDILNTEISPELLPPDEKGNIAQKTEDIVGPYLLHDFFLYYAVRWGFLPEKVQFLAEHAFCNEFDKKTIGKWLKKFYERFFRQQFKRSCMPDGVKVGSVTLSPRGDWRMPSDAVAAVWTENIKE